MKRMNADIRMFTLHKKKPNKLFILNMMGSGSTRCNYGYFNMVIDLKFDDLTFIDINNKINLCK